MLMWNVEFSFNASLNEHHFVEEAPSDEETLLIEKHHNIKETFIPLKMKPQSSHLPFKNRFIFEGYPSSSEKDFTVKRSFHSGLITPSPH